MGSGNGDRHDSAQCRVREILDLVADKWSLYTVSYLGDGPRRFTELKRGIDGISPRMLTVTLRGLERDGIVARTVFQVMPPHVDYELTAMGKTLLPAIAPLIEWSSQRLPSIDQARADYDARAHASPAVVASASVWGGPTEPPRPAT
jgi:DNA-binding HxlR family transcriptional regulator